MLNKYARNFFTRLFTPLARFLLKHHISPDAVTLIGTLGVVGGSLFFITGHLLIGVIVITVFVFADVLDGVMARLLIENSSEPIPPSQRVWGTFLDSTLDRVSDAAIFSGLLIWFFTDGDSRPIAVTSLMCMILGLLVSYSRAKAESLGLKKKSIGFAQRGERVVFTLVGAGLVGLGLPDYLLLIALIIVAVGSALTLAQRIFYMWNITHRRSKPASTRSCVSEVQPAQHRRQ